MTLTKSTPAGERKPRTIDVPLEQLPPIDERCIEIDAPAELAWAALFPSIEAAFATSLAHRYTEHVGALETEAHGDLHHPGGTLPGFTVTRAIAPVMLAMAGEHRFAKYAIVFRIDLMAAQRSCVRLETRAEFKGGRGRLYRAAVIGTRGHVLMAHRILRRIKRRAERGASGT